MTASTRTTSSLALLALGLAAAGCSRSSGPPGSTAAALTAPDVTRLLPVRVARPAAVTSLTTAWAPATPAGSAVVALGAAPGGELLAAVSGVGRVVRLPAAGPAVDEVLLPHDVTSFATVGSATLLATGNPRALRGGAVYRRDGASWRLDRDATRATAVVAALGSWTYAVSGDARQAGSGAQASKARPGAAWTDVAVVFSGAPAVALGHRERLWVGGRSSTDDGARLARGLDGSWLEARVPLEAAPGERLAVVGLAAGANGVLYAAVAGEDARDGLPTRGALLAWDEPSEALVALATLEGDAPRCLAAAEGTVYLGTAGGRVLWLDEQGALREEPGVPANDGVQALLAHAGALHVGVRGATGALLLRRPLGDGLAVARITPAFGPTAGGTQVELLGVGLEDVTAVRLGGQPLDGIAVTSSRVTGTTRAYTTPGFVDVVVVTASHGTVTLPGGFEYRVAGGGSGPRYSPTVRDVLTNRTCRGCHNPSMVPQFPLTQPTPGIDDDVDYPVVRSKTNLNDPVQSKLLTKPLGSGHATIFASTNDPDYVKLLDWVRNNAPR